MTTFYNPEISSNLCPMRTGRILIPPPQFQNCIKSNCDLYRIISARL